MVERMALAVELCLKTLQQKLTTWMLEQRGSELERQAQQGAVVPRHLAELALLKHRLTEKELLLAASAQQGADASRDLLQVGCFRQKCPGQWQMALEVQTQKSFDVSTSLQQALEWQVRQNACACWQELERLTCFCHGHSL
jgi:hypothetical protein